MSFSPEFAVTNPETRITNPDTMLKIHSKELPFGQESIITEDVHKYRTSLFVYNKGSYEYPYFHA